MRDFTKLPMADRYQILESGRIRSYTNHVEDPTKPAVIREFPQEDGNDLYETYKEWVALGNTIEPEFTAEELLERALKDEIVGLKEDLRSAQVWQFRMMIELFSLLKGATVVTNADVDPEILAHAQSWIAKLNRLKEIDE